jgi:hypothetical protein
MTEQNLITKVMKFRKERHKDHARQSRPQNGPRLGQLTPYWVGRLTTAPPHLVLCPWSGMSPIHSIFIYVTFCFEPN